MSSVSSPAAKVSTLGWFRTSNVRGIGNPVPAEFTVLELCVQRERRVRTVERERERRADGRVVVVVVVVKNEEYEMKRRKRWGGGGQLE